MNLLKSNFRFSKILSPGEALQSRWSPTAPEDFEDTLRFSVETLCPLPLQFPTTEISLWINTYTCRAYFYSQSILLLQDTLRIFCDYCLAVLCHLNTPKNNFSHLPSIRSSQLFRCFTKVFEILFNPPKILWSLWLLKFLLACIMDNPISLVVILTFLLITILSLLTQYVCEYTQSSLILISYFSGWAAILLTGIGSRPIQLSLIVP